MKNKIVKNCLVCNKVFSVYPCIANRKFCSRTCYWSDLKTRTPWNKGEKVPQMSGKNHPRWKKGGCVRSDGYILKTINGERNLEHRHVMEKKLGRKLSRDECVHHINKNRKDNRIENLKVMTNSEHVKLHLKERWSK